MTDFDPMAAKTAIEKAHGHVHDLCEGKAKWTMRVPADEARDSDLVISAGLEAGGKALAEVERLRTELDAQKFAVREYQSQIKAFTDPDSEAFRKFVRREIRIHGGAPW